MNPREKGDVLEAAVAAIERHILATSPALRDRTFVIESKKVINVGDVHHEIDIFVTIDLGRGYQPIYIFECKNWQDSVGKNFRAVALSTRTGESSGGEMLAARDTPPTISALQV